MQNFTEARDNEQRVMRHPLSDVVAPRRSRGSRVNPGNDGRGRSEISDDMLLMGFGTGDPRASLAFVRRFQAAMYGVAAAVVGDPGLAEDVTQQAFERAWRQAELYDPCRAPVRSWLMTITRNLAIDTVRVRRPDPLDSDDLERLVGAMRSTPEGHALAREVSTRLRAALGELPPEQARAAVLSAVHGMTAAQLAAMEHIPVGTAKSRIRAALRKLHDSVPSTENLR
jgi:RNA polymerase sigma-70 factor (ECF subfamily)